MFLSKNFSFKIIISSFQFFHSPVQNTRQTSPVTGWSACAFPVTGCQSGSGVVVVAVIDVEVSIL